MYLTITLVSSPSTRDVQYIFHVMYSSKTSVSYDITPGCTVHHNTVYSTSPSDEQYIAMWCTRACGQAHTPRPPPLHHVHYITCNTGGGSRGLLRFRGHTDGGPNPSSGSSRTVWSFQMPCSPCLFVNWINVSSPTPIHFLHFSVLTNVFIFVTSQWWTADF